MLDLTPLQILEQPIFDFGDLMSVTGATRNALDQLPRRGIVELGEHAAPGKGERRALSAIEIIRLTAIYAARRVGFPLKHAAPLADLVEARCRERLTEFSGRENYGLIMFPSADGGFSFIEHWNGQTPKGFPAAALGLQVDRVIDVALEQLGEILNKRTANETE